MLILGQASVSNDTVALQVDGTPASTTCLFFQALYPQSQGAGAVFGDGKLLPMLASKGSFTLGRNNDLCDLKIEDNEHASSTQARIDRERIDARGP